MIASVIIPTYNRANLLVNLLKQLNCQTFSPELMEIIVCSDGSTDGTVEIVSDFQSKISLKVFDTLKTSEHSPAAARNIGINHAEGHCLIFLDDDMYPSKEFVKEHIQTLEKFKNINAIVFGSRNGHEIDSLIGQDNPEYQAQPTEFEDTKECSEKSWEWAKVSNLSLQKKLIEKVGFFNERFNKYGYEDTEFLFRAYKYGIKFIHNPNAMTEHISNISEEDIQLKLKGLEEMRLLMKEIHPEFDLKTSTK